MVQNSFAEQQKELIRDEKRCLKTKDFFVPWFLKRSNEFSLPLTINSKNLDNIFALLFLCKSFWHWNWMHVMQENYGLLEIMGEILVLKVTTEGKEKHCFCWLDISFCAFYWLVISFSGIYTLEVRLIQRNLPRNISHESMCSFQLEKLICTDINAKSN